ncbi:hypothetical protein [Oceanobacillus sp. Castelsardo]|uniref:hypothetical protein n=1 Tax=Oceanobacillus sp. Castelsardo TaxID=1851204 RepID=UPI0008383A5C|nr:hypothetical protein [Oceanobacillus sp. Castelsardo]
MEYTILSITFLIVFIVISLLMKVVRLEGRIKTIQYSLDQLANLSEGSEPPVNDDLRKLIREGKDVKAVKKARESLGLSLIEGKNYIDKLKMEDK